MTVASIASGTSVFVDANTFVYAFAPDPQFGPPIAGFVRGLAAPRRSGKMGPLCQS